MHFSFLIVFFGILNVTYGVSKHPLTIVVSFDAFYYKYLERNVTPTILKLFREGSRTKYMVNIFPTKTYPNHFAIATGRYAEEHGVLENSIFDPILNKTITYSEELFTYNKTIVPIWTLNEMTGDDRHSGVMMWPGGEFAYKGVLPTFERSFKFGFDFKRRVDEAVTWITNPTTPANLVFLYFEEPDAEGHIYGPNSANVTNSLKSDDEVLQHLLDKLKDNHVNNYNLIVLSDHGMASVPFEHIIDLNKTLSSDLYNYYGSSPTLEVFPKPGKEKEVESKLREAANSKSSHFRFFLKDEIPDKWHYKNSPRSPPMFLLADDGYVFSDIYKSLDYYKEKLNITIGPNSTIGSHGYDPAEDNMHPIFIASGPAFKANHTVNVFNNVDLYSLFAHVLGISLPPGSHSGNFAHVKDLLINNSAENAASTSKIILFVGTIFIFLMVIVTGVFIVSIRCITVPVTVKWQRRQFYDDVEYNSLEDCHLLTVFSESDETTDHTIA